MALVSLATSMAIADGTALVDTGPPCGPERASARFSPLMFGRIAVLGARSAPRETGNHSRAVSGRSGRSRAEPLTGSHDGPDRAAVDHLVALDPRWVTTLDHAPSARAGFDARTAYVPLKDGRLVAVDLDDGRVRWDARAVMATPPATGDGLVFVAEEARIVALEEGSGRSVWHTDLPAGIGAPLYWDTGWLIASTTAGDLVALRARDGQIIWRQPLGATLAVPPTPAGDRLYVALDDGRIAALSLVDGAAAWTMPQGEAVTGMLALDEQLLVGTRANRLHSLTLSRGRVRWSQRAGADVAGDPAADDERIYFVALDNVLRALDRGSGNVRWIRRLPARPAAGPVRTGDVVLVPFATAEIAAFTATTGAEAFTMRAAGELGGPPFVRETTRSTAPRLIAMTRDGALQGFAPRIEPPPAPPTALPGVKVGG